MDKNFEPIIEKINNSSDIVLLVHESPDGDAIGSIISCLMALERMGKNVDAFIEKKSSNCEFLLNTIGKKVKTFSEMDIEKQYDLCIALDCGDVNRMGIAKKIFENAKSTICIDHHYTSSGFAEINYIDENASATGEIIFDLLNNMNVELNTTIATALYAAIASDTGNFKHSNTHKHTFEVAGNLIEYGIDITKISFHMFSETSLNRMRFLGKLLQNVKLYLNNKVGVLTAHKEDIESFFVEESELEGMVDYARYIKGVEVGIFIKPSNGMTKVSLRSNGNVDVSSLAQKFNGGGHKFASGCKFDTEDSCVVEKKLIDELSKVL